MKSFFINEAVDKAINDYLQSKNIEESVLFNSFLVVVVRILVIIYGELDIVNPYAIKNENLFLDNLLKFGAKKEDIVSFLQLLNEFYTIDNRNKVLNKREENVYFIKVQKCLIDLFNLKRVKYGTTLSDSQDFYDLLYTPTTKNPLRLSYNFLNANDVYEVANYYQESLNKDYYEMNNQSEELSELEDSINEKLYHTKPIYNNYEIKVDKVVEPEESKVVFNESITTGNGYVDILIIMSIIVTVVMVVVIFTTIVF